MLYFAYGSNMDWQRIKGRCPSVRFVCVANLEKHRFAFTRKCNAGHGVLDIVGDPEDEVWGVVYQIDELDMGRLDKAEGYVPGRADSAYRRVERMVFENGDRDKPRTVMTYEVVAKSSQHIPPSQTYKNYFVEGARHWRLPDPYIQRLDAVVAQKAPPETT